MVKKKTFVAMLMFVAWLMPAIAFADSYSSMWKQWSKMCGRDLPKSELAVLQKIVDKATAERAYGHLLKAQVLAIDAQISVSPDSLRSGVNRLERLYAKTEKSNPVLAATYASVLGKAYDVYPKLCDDKAEAQAVSRAWYDKALA